MKLAITAALIGLCAAPLWAENMMKRSPLSVAATIDGLEAAVNGAGATVFARVDHAAGAQSVDKSIPDATLLIFGNPALGTLAMEQDIRAGLVLPLQVLAYTDADGNTQMTWTPAEELLEGLDIAPDAEVIGKINGALNMLTDKAMSAN
ncbi:DUF302 domain-containing protein [Roseobacter sp. CCS2]|uniref:DUF302 domain-containing protein n=1 Tax=Roseobacter sp. CCS2 TaxID=391593 RepID=UPI0000F3E0C5|nr:DUF302 domain-containing protein [Roseobacter sp. CCS2]EBA12763.1 hypothetical protein RCCS2_15739 [Roseobacter sp. CCS2]